MRYWDNLYWLIDEKPPGHFSLPGRAIERPTVEEAWCALARGEALRDACREAVRTDDQDTLKAVEERLENPALTGKVQSLYIEQRDRGHGRDHELTIESLLNRLRAAVVAGQLALAAQRNDPIGLKTLPGRLVRLLDAGANRSQTAELPKWPRIGSNAVEIADGCLKSLAGSNAASVAAARDMVRTLLKEPRPAVSRSVKVPVLYFDPREAGLVLFLELDRLGDGTGELFAEPFVMGLWPTQKNWLDSLQSAWKNARQIAANSGVDVDVRWRLSGLGYVKQGWPRMIEGGSAGALAAVTLARLLDGEPVEERITLTATVDDARQLGPVEGVFDKVRAALEKRIDGKAAINRIVVHPNNAHNAREAARTVLSHSHFEPIATAQNLDEAVEAVRKHAQEEWPDISLSPPDPPSDLVGRKNVVEKVRLHAREHSGYLVLMAGMGRGKTALMHQLIQHAYQKGEQPLWHLINQGSAASSKPRDIAEKLYQRLRYKFRQLPLDDSRNLDISERLSRLLDRISNTVLEESGPREVIYIDAADEIEGDAHLIGGILPSMLPSGFCCVISSRHEVPGEKSVTIWNLDEEGYFQDRDDIREYLRHPDSPLDREFVEQIVTHTPDPPVFVTVSALLRRLREGNVSSKERAELLSSPRGWLQPAKELFMREWERVADLAEHHDILSTSFARILGRMALAGESLSRAQLQPLDLWDTETERVLKLARSFFKPYNRQNPHALYQFEHGGFREEILSRLSTSDQQDCHQRLAAGCLHWNDLEQDSRRYALAHLPRHLIHSKQWDQLEEILCGSASLPFLEAKAEAGMVFGLAEDYREAAHNVPRDRAHSRWLPLIEEALRRDIYFLEEHPTALFQCLWNNCWWYDCDEAAGHYESPDGPWNQPGPKISAMLQEWREMRRSREGVLCWLRSLRPPLSPLGPSECSIFRGHACAVERVAYSPDGKRLYSVYKHKISYTHKEEFVWDAETGKPLCHFGLPSHLLNCSPEELKFQADLRTETLCRRTWHSFLYIAPGLTPSCIAVRSHAHQRVEGRFDGKVELVMSDSINNEQYTVLGQHAAAVQGVAVSPDERLAATAGRDKRIRIWDLDQCQQKFCLRHHHSWTYCVAFSPNGDLLASGGSRGELRLWSFASNRAVSLLRGHHGTVYAVAFSPDGTLLASGGRDGTVRVWNVTAATELYCFEGHDAEVTTVAFNPTGDTIASGSFDKAVRLWRLPKQVATLSSAPASLPRRESSESTVTCLALSPREDIAASGHMNGDICLWKTATGTLLHRFCAHRSELVRVLAFSPDGSQLVSGGRLHTLLVSKDDGYGDFMPIMWFYGDEEHGPSLPVDNLDYHIPASGDFRLRVWKLRQDAGSSTVTCDLVQNWKGHQYGVFDVFWERKTTSVVSRGFDGKVLRWYFNDSHPEIVADIRSHGREKTSAIWNDVRSQGDATKSTKENQLNISHRIQMASFCEMAVRENKETVVKPANDDTIIARLPEIVRHVKAISAEESWIGAVGPHVSMFRLEGAQ